MKWLKNSWAIILNAIPAACCGRDKIVYFILSQRLRWEAK